MIVRVGDVDVDLDLDEGEVVLDVVVLTRVQRIAESGGPALSMAVSGHTDPVVKIGLLSAGLSIANAWTRSED